MYIPVSKRPVRAFTGIIAATTPDKCEGTVKLDETIDGVDYAVINRATHGLTGLMNEGNGQLVKGSAVRGTGIKISGAITAQHIELNTAVPNPIPPEKKRCAVLRFLGIR